ncbi:hypothetical protein DAI22_12g170600 [Oryza sativa Japonica Group]|jgi:hypothetical protein|nr:hypothetical protein DAI22_12g170600 [Oryza sativa Japonica Group]
MEWRIPCSDLTMWFRKCNGDLVTYGHETNHDVLVQYTESLSHQIKAIVHLLIRNKVNTWISETMGRTNHFGAKFTIACQFSRSLEFVPIESIHKQWGSKQHLCILLPIPVSTRLRIISANKHYCFQGKISKLLVAFFVVLTTEGLTMVIMEKKLCELSHCYGFLNYTNAMEGRQAIPFGGATKPDT